MNWKQATPDEKVKWLNQRLVDIETAKALLDEFASLTKQWLKKVQAAK